MENKKKKTFNQKYILPTVLAGASFFAPGTDNSVAAQTATPATAAAAASQGSFAVAMPELSVEHPHYRIIKHCEYIYDYFESKELSEYLQKAGLSTIDRHVGDAAVALKSLAAAYYEGDENRILGSIDAWEDRIHAIKEPESREPYILYGEVHENLGRAKGLKDIEDSIKARGQEFKFEKELYKFEELAEKAKKGMTEAEDALGITNKNKLMPEIEDTKAQLEKFKQQREIMGKALDEYKKEWAISGQPRGEYETALARLDMDVIRLGDMLERNVGDVKFTINDIPDSSFVKQVYKEMLPLVKDLNDYKKLKQAWKDEPNQTVKEHAKAAYEEKLFKLGENLVEFGNLVDEKARETGLNINMPGGQFAELVEQNAKLIRNQRARVDHCMDAWTVKDKPETRLHVLQLESQMEYDKYLKMGGASKRENLTLKLRKLEEQAKPPHLAMSEFQVHTEKHILYKRLTEAFEKGDVNEIERHVTSWETTLDMKDKSAPPVVAAVKIYGAVKYHQGYLQASKIAGAHKELVTVLPDGSIKPAETAANAAPAATVTTAAAAETKSPAAVAVSTPAASAEAAKPAVQTSSLSANTSAAPSALPSGASVPAAPVKTAEAKQVTETVKKPDSASAADINKEPAPAKKSDWVRNAVIFDGIVTLGVYAWLRFAGRRKEDNEINRQNRGRDER